MSERDYAKEHDAILAEDAEKKAIIRRKYSIKDAVRRANEIVTIIDDTLGEVQFGVLTIQEFQDLGLDQCTVKQQMLDLVLTAMLKKADPQVTLEMIKTMPADDYTIITTMVGKYLPGFLRLGEAILQQDQKTQQNSKAGSTLKQ